MPLHDWTRVHAGTFHSFHQRWITHLTEQLNNQLLPRQYYADAEQITRSMEADILTLREPPSLFQPASSLGGVALAEASPQLEHRLRFRLAPTVHKRQTHLVVRHVSGDRVVAIIEIVSPANKDRASHVENFVSKIVETLKEGIHVLMMDLFPPSSHDPNGLHAAIITEAALSAEEPGEVPIPTFDRNRPLSFAAYHGGAELEAFADYRSVGEGLPIVPLFLSEDRYVNVPLEESYQRAWAGTPARWRRVLDPDAFHANGSEG